jgi:hypothetical protein
MVVAIGLSLLDCYADPRISFGANARDRTEQFTKLFDLVYDGFREVQAIDLFGQNNWSMLYSHLLTRRALIENERNNCDSHFAVTFAAQSTHSLTSMLKDVAGL